MIQIKYAELEILHFLNGSLSVFSKLGAYVTQNATEQHHWSHFILPVQNVNTFSCIQYVELPF